VGSIFRVVVVLLAHLVAWLLAASSSYNTSSSKFPAHPSDVILLILKVKSKGILLQRHHDERTPLETTSAVVSFIAPLTSQGAEKVSG
jgi:hypothetical protein